MNFSEIVNDYKSNILEDLNGLLSIESVRSESTLKAPVGQGPKDALMYMMSLGERDGMNTKVVKDIAGHIELGEGENLFGILGHVDVVPSGTGWETPPFEPSVKDGVIYARGVQDDKGPTIAAYYAMKILKDLDVDFKTRVRLIIGTDEESDWECTQTYFKNEEMPNYGFAPDAEFPVIHGEKGMTTFDLVFNSDVPVYGDVILNTIEAGERYNMVPEVASANLSVKNVGKFKESFNAFLNHTGLDGSVESSNDSVDITVYGKSAHGSTPKEGKNAGIELMRYLKGINLDERAFKFIAFQDEYILNNFDAKPFKMDYQHEAMGGTTVNTGIIQYNREGKSRFGVNLRYPIGMNFDAGINHLKENLEPFGITIENIKEQVPHYVDKNSQLVKTLMKSYKNHVNDNTQPFTIGGGTYARVLESGVAFGAMFKDTKDTMHQKNEQLKIEELLLATTIYLDALYSILVDNALE